jgi:hypothetical protein
VVSAAEVRHVLDRAWDPAGYTSPSPGTYRWQWLWDSCFHCLLWAALGDERAVVELETLFTAQGADGFVPHVTYHRAPDTAADYWGRSLGSTLTQPPMFGHAVRVLDRRGFTVSERVVEAATAAIDHLWSHRRRDHGLVVIVHPWESGCDDSIRWATWMPDPFVKQRWDETKYRLVRSAVVVDGGARANPGFEVASVAFNALVAFNAAELAAVSGSDRLAAVARELAELLATRWSAEDRTWVDGAHPSAAAPTLEALLPALVVDGADGNTDAQLDCTFAQLTDEADFAARYGLRQTSRRHGAYDPDAYWRGATWPQLDYLLWLAATRRGRTELAAAIASATAAGVARSRLAEHWNPETGRGGGAIPQAWSGLAWLMGRSPMV